MVVPYEDGRSTEMTTEKNPTVASITFDCQDPMVLAEFWSGALRRPLGDGSTSKTASVAAEPPWSFMAVPEPKSAKNRVHLDLLVDDLAREVDRLVRLGAKRLGGFDEDGYRWTTLADPEGNEFDVAVHD
jgi:hypothetical protein